MPFERPPFLEKIFDVTNVSVDAVVGQDPSDATPTTIIRTDQNWYVKVEWDTEGPLVPLIAGKWHLHVYLESIGPGDDYELFDKYNEHDIELPAEAGPVHYHMHPDIDKMQVKAGAYKLVVTVTYTNRIDKPFPMAGYWEGPIVQFIEP